MSTKNTEVKVFVNNSDKAIIILVPVESAKFAVVHSTKSKSKDSIKLMALEGRVEEAEEKMNKIAESYNKLVQPYLEEVFPGVPLRYTENKKLLSFDFSNDDIRQVWFTVEVNALAKK